LFHAAAGEVVDGNGVRPCQRRDLDALNAVQVHCDVALGTKSVAPSPLAEMVMFSATVAAVEHHRVEAILTLDHVASVALVPDEYVVAVTERRHVSAGTADDDVIAVAAVDDIVARTTVDDEFDVARLQLAGVDRVIARAARYGELIEPAFSVCDCRRCREAAYADGTVKTIDCDGSSPAVPLTTT
jgi:hypothetical protein